MTDIFISYSRKDLAVASTLAETLQKLGYSVWWDMTGLHGGQEFAPVIQQKLSEAKCAIVLWSPDSVVSSWVQAEASFADNRGILLTAITRETDAPMPFNNRHNENLSDWDTGVESHGFQMLLKAVKRLCPEPTGSVKSDERYSSAAHKQGVSKQETPKTHLEDAALSEPEEPKQNQLSLIKIILPGALFVGAAVTASYFFIPPSEVNSDTPDATDTRVVHRSSTPPRIAKEGDGTIRFPKTNLSLMSIPAGSFVMGGKTGDVTEMPRHEVTFGTPFFISKTEITVDQYAEFTTARGDPENTKTNKADKGNHPVTNVTWHDAQAYAEWLKDSNIPALTCSLPTEAEWEYAARAGSTAKYFWGDEIGNNKANCNGCGSQWDDKGTAPVASFPANDWWLHDMHGNVREWVADVWHKNYEGAPTTGEVWGEGSDSSVRILRGGSWYFSPPHLRSASRAYAPATTKSSDIGFRVVCRLLATFP